MSSKVERKLIPLGKSESIVLVKVGGVVSASLIDNSDSGDLAEIEILEPSVKQFSKLNKPIMATIKTDLLTAKDNALNESTKTKKRVYIVVDKEGECEITKNISKGIMYAYQEGVESPLTKEEEEGKAVASVKEKKPVKVKTKKEKPMKKVTKKSVKKDSSRKSKASNVLTSVKNNEGKSFKIGDTATYSGKKFKIVSMRQYNYPNVYLEDSKGKRIQTVASRIS